MEQTIILTVGLPRSGKSTWAMQQGLPIVNPDSVRLALHGQPFIQQAEPWVWNMVYTMARALLIAGHPTIIVDATNTTKKRRDEWRKLFVGYSIRHKVFYTSADECKERAIDSNTSYLLPVIDRMANNFDLEEVVHYEPRT